MAQMNLSTEHRLTDMENRLVVAKGEGEGSGMGWEFGISRCKLLHWEWINNEDLLHSTGSYSQSLGIEHDGRKYEKKNVCTAEIDTSWYINCNLIFFN